MGNPHFKVAASHMRNGIAAKKQEVDSKRRQINEQAKQTNQNIQSIKTDIRVIHAEMAKPADQQTDPHTDRAHLTNLVMTKHKEISDHEKALMTEKDRLAREIKEEERELMELETQARALESKA